MASTFSFPLIVEGSPRKQLDGIGVKGQYDFVQRGTYQLVAFPVGLPEYGSSTLSVETDLTADAITSTKFFDARRPIDDPLTLVGPLNGSTVYTNTGTTTLTDTGPVRYALGRNDGYGDPVTYYLRGNSVNGVNRAGEVPSTPTGAVRYQPGPGGRINRHGNPRLANNSDGWNSYGGTFARVADPAMGGYAAEMTSTTLNNGLAIRGGTTRALVVDTNVVTISFDFKWVSGQAGAWYMSFWTTNRGGNGTFYANEGSGAIPSTYYDGNIYRLSYTVTLKNYYKDTLQVLFLRDVTTTGSSTIRVTNLVIEEGKVANPTYFDGDTEGAVWANHLTGVPGTPHATSSFTNAALWFEEGTTNLVLNPSCATGVTNITGFAAGGQTLSWDSASGFYNAGSAKVVTEGSFSYEGYGFTGSALNYAAGTARVFTGSVWVRGTQGETASLVLRCRQNNGVNNIDAVQTITFTGAWQRVSVSVTASATYTIQNLILGVLSGYGPKKAVTFWMTNAQIEENDRITSYADGSLGAGHGWSGTADASTSFRSHAWLAFPSAGNFPMRKGALGCWIKPFASMSRPVSRYINIVLCQSNGANRDYILLGLNSNTGYLTTQYGTYGVWNGTTQSSGAGAKVNSWNYIYFDWDERSVRVYLNNVLIDSLNNRTLPMNTNWDFVYLNDTTSAYAGNFALGHLTIYDQPLTSADRTKNYNNGMALNSYRTVAPTYATPPRINWCRNPALQNGWLDWASYNGGTYALTTGDKTSRAARITANGLGTGAGFRFEARPYVSYLVSFNARLIRGGGTNWAIGAQALSEDGTVLASPVLYALPLLSATWKRVSTMIYAPTDATQSIRALFTPRVDSGGVVEVEQFVVEEAHGFPAGYPAPYFDGDTPGAKWADPIMQVPGTAHASPSISAVSPYFEPAGTNLLLNPSFENALGDDVMSASGGILQRNTTFAYSGIYSLRVQTPGLLNAQEGVILRSARNLGTTTARTFTTSVYVRQAGNNLSIQVVPLVAYTDGTIVYGSYQVITVYNQWVRFNPAAITTVTNKTLDYVGMQVYVSGTTAATWYIDNAQIEERNHVTSYIDGSLGTGYAWTGTPHASASTRADTTAAVANAASVLSPSTGAVAFWYYRTATLSNTYEMVNIGYYGTNDYIGVFQGPGAPPAIRTKNGAATADEAQWGTTPTVLQNVWHFVYAEWTPTTLRIAVDGGTPVTANRTGGVSGSFRSGYSELRLGRNLIDNTYRLFGAMSPVQVFNRTLTTTEINDLYAGGLPVTEPVSATQLAASALSTHNALTLLTAETEAIPRPNRITLGVAPDDGQGDLSATALVDNAALAALDASSDATFGESVQCDALATLDADSDASFAESVQCAALADVSADSDASFAESVLCNAFAALDADTDATADAIADCAALAALDANTDLTVDAVCDVAALASLDSATNAILIAIATVPGDVWLTAAGDLTAAGVLARAGATALDAATDSTARLNGAYLGFLTTAIARDPGFPIPVISGVPLPYLHGTTNTDLVSVAGVALPFNYVNYIDGGLILAQGGVKRPAFASFSAETDSTANALNMVDGVAALDAATNLETGMLHDGVAALRGDGTLAAVPAVMRHAVSAASALGDATASAVVQRDGNSPQDAASTFTADASADVPAQAALEADRTVAALAVVEHSALSGMSATTTVSADSIALVPDSAFIDALGAVTAGASVTWAAAAATTAATALTAAASVTWAAQASGSATTMVTAAGARIYASALGPDGVGDLLATASRIYAGVSSMDALTEALAEALNIVDGLNLSAGSGILAAAALVTETVIRARQADLLFRPMQAVLNLHPVQPVLVAQSIQATINAKPTQPKLQSINAMPTLRLIED